MTGYEPKPELVRKAVEGDETARRSLFSDLRRTMKAFARGILGSAREDTVEDATQDILLKIHRTLHRFDPTRGVKFTSWALTYGRNHCYDLLKKKRLTTFSLDQSSTAGSLRDALPDDQSIEPGAALQDQDFVNDLERAVQELDGIHRQIFELRIIRELDYREISRRIGIESGTAKSRMHRAKRILRERLSEWDPQPSCRRKETLPQMAGASVS